MVWTCIEEIQQIYWTKDFGHGTAWQKEKRKTQEKIHGLSEEGRQVVGVTALEPGIG